jgi:uncharacterized tellurite resistance protein B-like protein
MPLLMLLLVAVLALGFYFLSRRVPRLSRGARDWGSAGADDPRMAVAAMMYAVAREDGPVTADKEEQILSLLRAKVGLDAESARICLTGGKRMARMVRGNLNSRLHQFLDPIERKCSAQERQDVLDMLHAVAGRSAGRLGSIRESLGRLSSSLLQS